MQRPKRRSAGQFTICSTAISGVETALQAPCTGENKDFVNSVKVYLRAAIAQFVAARPSTAPPVLSQRPKVGTRLPPSSQWPFPETLQGLPYLSHLEAPGPLSPEQVTKCQVHRSLRTSPRARLLQQPEQKRSKQQRHGKMIDSSCNSMKNTSGDNSLQLIIVK